MLILIMLIYVGKYGTINPINMEYEITAKNLIRVYYQYI